MKQKLRKQTMMPSNPTELFLVLSEIWNSMTDTYFHDLVPSMAARVEIVKGNRAGRQSID